MAAEGFGPLFFNNPASVAEIPRAIATNFILTCWIVTLGRLKIFANDLNNSSVRFVRFVINWLLSYESTRVCPA
jgi:hypothetical protein